jgi:hypothetical protein
MSASFGEEIATKFKKSKNVWAVDAMYKDVSGSATMTEAETEQVTKILSDAGKIFSKLQRNTLEGISDNEDLLMRVKAFINTKVREGQRIGNTTKFVDDLVTYLTTHYRKEIDKLKTPAGRTKAEEKTKEAMRYFVETERSQIIAMFDLYNHIVDAKLIIVRKLDKAKQVGTFLRTADGYKVTEQEGFVAIDHLGKNAVKLIDRLQFSYANFSPDTIKGWQK